MSELRPPESPFAPSEARLPFSKGLMAQAFLGTGISIERAYGLARLVEGELVRGGDGLTAGPEHVFEVAATVLAEHEGEQAVRRLRRYQALQETDLPLIVLVGGATGTGKSTITTEVAHRLGITRVTSTDFVRQTMRAFFSEDFMPTIHHSSFEAGKAIQVEDNDRRDANRRGFLEQTRNVLVGVTAVIERAVTESYSMALEGVHLVPGLVPATVEGAIVSQCLITISNEEEHASHFYVRDADSQGLRPVEKYLRALPEIRRIQEFLVARAEEAGVAVIENSDKEQAVDSVIRLVLDTFERTQAPA